jgi:hypothetical protein
LFDSQQAGFETRGDGKGRVFQGAFAQYNKMFSQTSRSSFSIRGEYFKVTFASITEGRPA